MGGVNFTRNRAWWHTVIWDEYGQRHQYLAIFPTMAYLIPLYYYGTFINRSLEQCYAAKMYQLEFENRRLRLTHNLIMEHFETHVEKVQIILDDVKKEGFEKAFEYEIKYPFTQYIHEPIPTFNEELLAELAEYSGLTQTIDDYIEHKDIPYWQRQEFEKSIYRRKTPFAPYRFINKIVQSEEMDNIEHTYLNPYQTSVMFNQGNLQIQAEEEN